MQELAPTSPRVDLVLQYLQDRPTPLLGENNNKSKKNPNTTHGTRVRVPSLTLVTVLKTAYIVDNCGIVEYINPGHVCLPQYHCIDC